MTRVQCIKEAWSAREGEREGRTAARTTTTAAITSTLVLSLPHSSGSSSSSSKDRDRGRQQQPQEKDASLVRTFDDQLNEGVVVAPFVCCIALVDSTVCSFRPSNHEPRGG